MKHGSLGIISLSAAERLRYSPNYYEYENKADFKMDC